MTRLDASTLAQLMMRARYTLSTAHSDVPSLLHTSKRTMQRWQAAQAHPSDTELAAMARHLHPIDAQLAASVAEAAGQTLESLGVIASKPPPAPVLPPMPRHLESTATVPSTEASSTRAPLSYSRSSHPAQARDVPVVRRLLAAITRLGGIGEHLDDEDGIRDGLRVLEVGLELGALWADLKVMPETATAGESP